MTNKEIIKDELKSVTDLFKYQPEEQWTRFANITFFIFQISTMAFICTMIMALIIPWLMLKNIFYPFYIITVKKEFRRNYAAFIFGYRKLDTENCNPSED